MDTKRERIEKLVAYYGNGKKARLSAALGGSAELVAGWIRRDYIDIDKVLTTFPAVNAHWLRTGEGEMLTNEQPTINQSIGNGNTNAYNIANTDAEQLAQLKAENEALKEEIKWLRFVVEKHLRKP